MRRTYQVLALLFAGCLLGGPVSEACARETAPDSVVVRRGPLGATIKLKGVFTPTKHELVSVRPKAYKGALEVVEAAREGRVVKGQVLVQFDVEDLERQITSARVALDSGRNKLVRQERDIALKGAERAIEMDGTVRAKRIADEKLEQFVTVERKLREREALHRMEGWTDGLKNQLEELQQLEKMYGEDDLTEETEEIVLRRARRSYERALERFEFNKRRHEWFMTQTLPREDESLRLEVRKQTAKLDRLKATQQLDIEKQKLDLAGTKLGQLGLERRLAELEADRVALTVKAPMAGHAVPGTFGSGKWGGLDTAPAMLAPGKQIKAGTVLFTVVDPSSLVVETAVKEADLVHVKPGLPASVTTPVTGKARLEGKVESVARFGTGGNYAVRVRVASEDERLRTGLGCSVRITKEAPEEVLSVPVGCLREDDGTFYAFLLGESGPEPVEVQVGRTAEGRREITEGLKAGQRVLKKPPEEKE